MMAHSAFTALFCVFLSIQKFSKLKVKKKKKSPDFETLTGKNRPGKLGKHITADRQLGEHPPTFLVWRQKEEGVGILRGAGPPKLTRGFPELGVVCTPFPLGTLLPLSPAAQKPHH